ncbi:MAG: hypothetical protein AAFZ92_00920 [Pseudomonadota bacterium]
MFGLKRLLCILCLFAVAARSVAECVNIPADQNASHQQLVERTDTIALATALAPQRINGDIYVIPFRVVERIKGSPPLRFEITGLRADDSQANADFNRHNDLKFWVYANTGNFKRTSDCNIYGYFRANRQYLVFIDKPHHPRSFELITADDDAWLAEVKKIVAESTPPLDLTQ